MLPRFAGLVDTDPDAVALIEHERIVTRAELLSRVHELAPRFRPRELTALQVPNSAEFVATLLAAVDRGAIVILFDRDAPRSEVAAVMHHFGRPKLPPEACILKLSSGSTGMPKAIVCSVDNLIADARNICSTMDIRPADTNLGAIPFSHSYGFSNLVIPLLIQGTAVVVSNEYLPLSLLGLANRHRCTVAPLIPMVFEHLCRQRRSGSGNGSESTFIRSTAAARSVESPTTAPVPRSNGGQSEPRWTASKSTGRSAAPT